MRILVTALLLAACGDESRAPTPEPSLAGALILQTDAVVTRGGLAAHVVTSDAQLDLSWAMDRLALRVETDGAGRAWLRRLEMPLGELIPTDPDRPVASPLPGGIVLRDLEVGVKEPLPCEVAGAEPDRLVLTGEAVLSLDWKLQLEDGSLHRLGPLPTGPVALLIAFSREGGDVTARVSSLCRGDCAGIPYVMSVTALAVAAEAPATLLTR